MPDSFKALVVSDLHAIDDPNRARVGPTMNYGAGSTARGLLQLCVAAIRERYRDGIDLVLVAGDMTDHAGGGPLSAIWGDLHWLADQFGAPIVATSGNHDYDSRASDGPLPYSSLITLEPPFPFDDGAARDRYFSQHHAVFANDRAVVITANSAAHHGYTYEGEPEHGHGRFNDMLPGMIARSLAEVGALPPVRIFLTHHPLNQLPDFDTEERSSSVGHEAVLRMLLEDGDWLVVHGHKHRGWLQYASGSGDSPPLLSSSSFSADLGNDSFSTKVRHQFHVVELPIPAPLPEEGIPGVRGLVTSWTHSPLGWTVASRDEDLPGISGFGWKTSVRQLAAKIRSLIESEVVLRREEILAFEPRIDFLTFDDLRRLVAELRNGTPEVTLILSDEGYVSEVSLTEETAA